MSLVDCCLGKKGESVTELQDRGSFGHRAAGPGHTHRLKLLISATGEKLLISATGEK